MKKRFYSLTTGLRVNEPVRASALIMSAIILHNLAIKHGDLGEDLEEGDAGPDEDDLPEHGHGSDDQPAADQRRLQLLQYFS